MVVVMDIQKEREDFEKFKAKQIGVDYEALKKDLDDCERRFPNNRYAGWNFKSDWELWQSAKSQAVPEGFLLVSSKELLDLTVAINALDLATHTESKTNEVREMWQDIALKLMALGEAQEQSHESD